MQRMHRAAALGGVTFIAVALSTALPAGAAGPTATNPALWLKADSLTGLSNGDPVLLWNDSSGSGNNAVAADNTTAPQYIAADPNFVSSKPSLNFDSGNDRLNAGPNVDATAFTIFSVFRATDLGFGAIVDMVNPSTSPLSENYALLTGQDTGQENWFLQWNNGAFDNINPGPNQVSYLNEYVIRTDQHDGAGNAAIYRNGVVEVSSTGDTNPITDPDNVLWIGHYQVGSTGFFGGQIAEILIYNTALSASERQAVEAYLDEKYFQIPEPATALLAVAATPALLTRRRRAGR